MRLAPHVGGVLPKWQRWNLDAPQSTMDRVRVDSGADGAFELERTLTHRVQGVGAPIRQQERWGVAGNGEMLLTQEVEIPRELDDLPRLGLLLRLRGGLEQLTYYGRGPEENYCDRNFGYPLGRYESTVDDEYVPYVTPQEHGNHTDVRWFALADANAGLLFQPDEPAQFSVSHFTMDDMYAARHTVDLTRQDSIECTSTTKIAASAPAPAGLIRCRSTVSAAAPIGSRGACARIVSAQCNRRTSRASGLQSRAIDERRSGGESMRYELHPRNTAFEWRQPDPPFRRLTRRRCAHTAKTDTLRCAMRLLGRR